MMIQRYRVSGVIQISLCNYSKPFSLINMHNCNRLSPLDRARTTINQFEYMTARISAEQKKKKIGMRYCC